jgi:octaprenyl-diphosphate synthase
MDEARIRRGRATLATKWGSEVSVLVGDCLFAHALKMATNFPATDVCRAIAEATSRVCTGEILQTHRRRRWGLARPEYYKVLEMKTAELFGLACGLGVRLAGGSAEVQAALRRYGLALGTAYQIYDDCLDLYGAENSAGKSLGTDLAKGKVTLPLLVLLERATPEDRNRLLGYLEGWRPEYCQQVRELLDAYHALPESIAVIHQFLDTARSKLVVVENATSAQSLVQFTDFLLQQTSALGV